MEPENHQFLIDLLKTIVKTAGSDGAAGPWKDTSLFKLVVEQRLREVFITGQDMKAWVALNHLLRRISIPPASIYDLRMASLWNLRDVLETSTVVVTVNMLKVLMLWLGGHVHWLQLQILRAHSKSYPSDTLINLGLGDLPAITGEKLQPVVDLDRLQFWRQRLQGVHDAETSDTMMKFYASAVLSLLKVGVAEVDEWNEELPVT
ncbi:uncharacterized protein RCC_01964 [Ramularia collo-cygni]|uniref:Uncharacterized protein n=1 Tax=Ramularia collo-cygni TaxID=112498 RepID=A0A2D3V705_9PEZI|nr:uncharacterized protein RCC_01964 [Ramularia collo-cygni]CZT16123.1 uncharacterized protein RCC_01964 [Ramularia collo-cygni]